MNLVIIYGAQATGKLTVANELSKLTRYKVLHNHLILDLVSSVVPYHSEAFYQLVEKIWIDMLEGATGAKVEGIITTFVYGGSTGAGESFVKELMGVVTSSGGSISPVLLICNQDELLRRVASESRKRFGKLQNPEQLKALLESNDPTVQIPDVKSLVIDTTDLPAKKAAAKITDHYSLD